MFHSRVQLGREQKADSNFVNALPDLLRRQIQIHAQLAEDIGAAALAAGSAVAMLGDADSGSCRDKRHRRADVERTGFVAACAAGVEEIIITPRRDMLAFARIARALPRISLRVSPSSAGPSGKRRSVRRWPARS
jgi:hypothetical protein